MRVLSPEEAEQVRKSVLRPLRWLPLSLVVGLVIVLSFVLRSSRGDDGVMRLVPLLFFVVPIVVLFYRKRQIEADLDIGFAETLEGEIEKLWRSQQDNFIRVAGKSFRVEREVFRTLAKGQRVSVDFLPRSRIAVKVEPRSSA